MCIFCGGQCGGVGEFLISLGLPLLALYFYRIKKALLRIINKIIPIGSGAEKAQDKVIKYRYCGELQSSGPHKIGLLRFQSPLNEPVQISTAITQFNNRQKLEPKGSPKGVKGWLLLLCLNLTIFIPASCLYEANCILDLFNSHKNKILLFIFKTLLLYNVLIVAIMVFLAIFSFYAGLRLWQVNQKAVKMAKAFLITQLSLTAIIIITRPLIDFPFGDNGQFWGDIMKRLIPSLLYFSLWYLYLRNSKRVYNTFSDIGKKRTSISQLPVKLAGSAELT